MCEWFSPYNIQRRIGSLIEISATEAKINLTKAGTGEEIWILGNRIPIGEVNEFIFIDCGKTAILGKITKVWLQNGERLSVDSLNTSWTDNNPIGLIQLLVSVDVETGFNYKGIKQYPKLGSQIYSAHPELISILTQKYNNDDNNILLPIAETIDDDPVTINLTPEKLFSFHNAILGSTGGGKSYTMANLICNIFKVGGKVLLIDPTGEYKNLPCDHYYVGNNTEAPEEKKLTYPHWMFSDTDIRALLRPSIQTQLPKLEEAIRSLKLVYTIQHNKSQEEYDLIKEDNLIKEGREKERVIKEMNKIKKDLSSIPWKFSALAQQIIEECVYPNSSKNKENNTWGNKNENEIGYCISLISRIEALKNNEYLKWMLDCDANEEKTIPNIIDQLCKSRNKIIRLDLSAVPFEANAREILVNAIGRKLLDCARKEDIHHKNPLIVFIDEAHQFLNKFVGDEINRTNLTAFGDIAKEGRKYGLNVVIATQRPRNIPEDILSQIGTFIVHRLTNEKDQDIIKKAVGFIDNQSASFLPMLKQGEALLLGIDFPFPMQVKIKTPSNKPESRSANFSESWKKKINDQN